MSNIFELAYVDTVNSDYSVNCKVHVTVAKKSRAFSYWFPAMNIIAFLCPNKNYKKVITKYVRPEFLCTYKCLKTCAIEISFWTGRACVEWNNDTLFINLAAVEMLSMLSERNDKSGGLYRLFPFLMPMECDPEKNLRFSHWIRVSLLPCISIDMAKIQSNETLSKHPYLSASIAMQSIQEEQQRRYIAITPSAPPLPEEERTLPGQATAPSSSSPSSTSQPPSTSTASFCAVSPHQTEDPPTNNTTQNSGKQLMDIFTTIICSNNVNGHEPEYVIFKTKYNKNESSRYKITNTKYVTDV